MALEDPPCIPIRLGSFDDFTLSMEELGEGGFGRVGLIETSDPSLQRLLAQARV